MYTKKETRPVEEMKAINIFLNKHVLFEYLTFYSNSKYYLGENFGMFTEKMMASFNKDDLLWNIFNKKPDELDVMDRDSAYALKSSINYKR